MAGTFLHFSGDTLLSAVHGLDNAKFDAAFPGVRGRRYDSYAKLVGRAPDGSLAAVERVIEYKRNPSKHPCDARCTNATGRIMRCECSCGGKNHGRGSLTCDAGI